MKILAIETLHVYAHLCDIFIIVAPPATHAGTKAQCDSASYFTRGWCRLEQYSRITAKGGVGNMFLSCGKNHCEAVTDAGLDDALDVMGGTFTCCQRGHPGGSTCDKYRIIDTMLGLYTIVAGQQKTAVIWKEVQQRRNTIYPTELFSDLTSVADEMLADGSLDSSTIAQGAKSETIQHQGSVTNEDAENDVEAADDKATWQAPMHADVRRGSV